MQNILRNSYDANSFVVLKGVFQPNEIDELLVHYDAFYANNSRDKLDEKAVTTPLPFPVEFYPPFQELISRKQRLFESIENIIGHDYFFLGSETIQVKNDTHGPHRDFCYSHDVLKALICLTDRYEDKNNENIDNEFTLKLDGAFMVYPGSHHIKGRHSFLNQRRTKWPSEEYSKFERISDKVLFGDLKADGTYYYPNENQQGRYAGFQAIDFEKGDVILFSTRAIHALYPQRQDFMMHFIGMLFVESFMGGYIKGTNKIKRFLDSITGNIIREHKRYMSIPVNSSFLYTDMRPHIDKKFRTKIVKKASKPQKDMGLLLPTSWREHPYITQRGNFNTNFSPREAKEYFYRNIKRMNKELTNYEKTNKKRHKLTNLILMGIKSPSYLLKRISKKTTSLVSKIKRKVNSFK